MITKPYTALLIEAIEASGQYLPLSHNDRNRLLALLPEDEFMFLTIKDNMYSEIVKVENMCGTLVMHRGEGETVPRKFPKGACVFFEVSVPVVTHLICHYDCCEGECPCDAVESAGAVLPQAKVGVPWTGSFVFTGDTPMHIGVDGVPAWVSVTQGANYVRLSGTPPAPGIWTLSVAATNCSGKHITVASGELECVA